MAEIPPPKNPMKVLAKERAVRWLANLVRSSARLSVFWGETIIVCIYEIVKAVSPKIAIN